MAADRLTELAEVHPLLATAAAELRARGISIATEQALLRSSIDDSDLSEFFDLVQQELNGPPLFGLTLALTFFVDQRGVGHRAFDRCLERGRLTESELAFVGQYMAAARSRAAVVWLHSRFTASVRDDAGYHTFLTRHAEVLLGDCGDEVTSYLLHPDRGPGRCNVDSVSFLIRQTPSPAALVQRWIDWIDAGGFDLDGGPGHESATVLYRILDLHPPTEVRRVVDAVERRVRLLLGSTSSDDLRRGVHHLVAMVEARYRGAARVLGTPMPTVTELTDTERVIVRATVEGLAAVAALHHGGEASWLEDRVSERYSAIFDADKIGWTGHWRIPPERTDESV